MNSSFVVETVDWDIWTLISILISCQIVSKTLNLFWLQAAAWWKTLMMYFLAETWFHTSCWVYQRSFSFFKATAEFSQNHFLNLSYHRLRSDLRSAFSVLLSRSVYHITVLSFKHKKRFILISSSFVKLTWFLILWIKTNTFCIHILSSTWMLSSSISNSELKNLMFSDLNCLFEALLSVDCVVMIFWDVELAFMMMITTLVIWAISCSFFSSLDKFLSLLKPVILKVELDCSDAGEKEKTGSRSWDHDLMLVSQFIYVEWVVRNLMRCKKLIWSALSLNFLILKLQSDGKSVDTFWSDKHSFWFVELSIDVNLCELESE